MSMKKTKCMVNKKKKKKKETKQELIQVNRPICSEREIMEERKISKLEKLVTRMSLEELRKATDDFNKDNLIGMGRMGKVYETMLPNGWSLAIKRLCDWHSFDQFVSELLILGRMRHANLVPMLGFSLELTETLLVYKYMSNGNLHDWLHTRPRGDPKTMGWNLRLKIAVGIARGLAWLHHNIVAHQNLSTKCILLDQNFEPKLSNFGDAKFSLIPSGCTSSGSWSVMVNGEFPDSNSYKKDVYSYGIVLLELITGKEPYQMVNNVFPTDNLLDWIIHLLSGRSCDGFDEYLFGQDCDEEIFQLLRVALNCIQLCEYERPTMLEVYEAIQAIGEHQISAANVGDACIDIEIIDQ